MDARGGVVRTGGGFGHPPSDARGRPALAARKLQAKTYGKLKARTPKHPGLELCCDQRPSTSVSSEALVRLETCRVALHLARGYIFHARHWFLFSCPCGARAGARARAVRPRALRPPTQATPCLRQSQVTHGSPTASHPLALRPHTYVRLRRRYRAAHPLPGANATPLPPPRPWRLGFLPAASLSQQGARAQGPPSPP